jgi:hypothetical protein
VAWDRSKKSKEKFLQEKAVETTKQIKEDRREKSKPEAQESLIIQIIVYFDVRTV